MTQTILITGTSSGFGHAAVGLLAGAGHTVYATMRDIEGANQAAAQELRRLPGVTVLPLEMSSTHSNEAAVARVIAERGRLDVVFNNAGRFFMGVGEAFTPEDLLAIYDEDVLGPWRLVRAALPHMRTQKRGLIVTVSSSLARFSCPYMTAYASAKHAIEGLLQGMKYELKPFNVDLSFIEPGIYPTRVFERYTSGSDAAVKAAYGPAGDMDRQIKQQLDGLFASGQANDPALVAQAMLRLVQLPAGQRPIRVPVDPQAGEITGRVNAAHQLEYENFLRGSGMGGLL